MVRSLYVRSIRVVLATAAALAGAGLVGCAASAPPLRPLPSYEAVEPDRRFEADSTRLRIKVRGDGEAPDFDQNLRLPIQQGSSIVISVPRGDALGADLAGNGIRSESYTDEFEQQVERALIRQRFDLRDRTKFEAILAQDGDNDGIDTQAQLINAARAGDAAYILQINEIRTFDDRERAVRPLDFTEVIEFAEANPGFVESGAADPISVKVMEAVFNAKIIAVDTGSVVWLGTHRVSSLELPRDGLELVITVTPRPNNLDELSAIAEDYDTKLRRVWTQAQRRHNELNDTRSRLSGSARATAVQDYNNLLDQYERMLEEAPDVGEDSFTYDYDYSIRMTPDFNAIFGLGGPNPLARRAHGLDLLQLAAREAIEMIEVSR